MGKNRKLPILAIVRAGTPEFQRFLISDDEDRLWTGSEFGETGILYAKFNAACTDTQEILKAHYEGIEPVRYVAPLFVEVFADDPVPQAKVAQYLSRATRLVLDTPKHGHGPEGSLLLTRIEWHRMEELRESAG